LHGGCAGVLFFCKRRADGALTQGKIKAEIAKAETFSPPLAEYVIATTEYRDAKLQQIVRQINEERRAEAFARSAGQLVSSLDRLGYWGEIRERLERAREATKKHLGSPPELGAGLLGDLATIAFKSAEWDEAIALWEAAAGYPGQPVHQPGDPIPANQPT